MALREGSLASALGMLALTRVIYQARSHQSLKLLSSELSSSAGHGGAPGGAGASGLSRMLGSTFSWRILI